MPIFGKKKQERILQEQERVAKEQEILKRQQRTKIIDKLDKIDSLPEYSRVYGLNDELGPNSSNSTVKGLLSENILDELKSKIQNNKLIKMNLYLTSPQELLPVLTEFEDGTKEYLHNIPVFNDNFSADEKFLVGEYSTVARDVRVNFNELKQRLNNTDSALPLQAQLIIELEEHGKSVYKKPIASYLIENKDLSVSLNIKNLLNFYDIISELPQNELTKDLLNGYTNLKNLNTYHQNIHKSPVFPNIALQTLQTAVEFFGEKEIDIKLVPKLTTLANGEQKFTINKSRDNGSKIYIDQITYELKRDLLNELKAGGMNIVISNKYRSFKKILTDLEKDLNERKFEDLFAGSNEQDKSIYECKDIELLLSPEEQKAFNEGNYSNQPNLGPTNIEAEEVLERYKSKEESKWIDDRFDNKESESKIFDESKNNKAKTKASTAKKSKPVADKSNKAKPNKKQANLETYQEDSKVTPTPIKEHAKIIQDLGVTNTPVIRAEQAKSKEHISVKPEDFKEDKKSYGLATTPVFVNESEQTRKDKQNKEQVIPVTNPKYKTTSEAQISSERTKDEPKQQRLDETLKNNQFGATIKNPTPPPAVSVTQVKPIKVDMEEKQPAPKPEPEIDLTQVRSLELLMSTLTANGLNIQNLNITLGSKNSINAGNTVAKKQTQIHSK